MELALFMSVLHIVQQHYEEALAVWSSCLELLLQYIRKLKCFAEAYSLAAHPA